MPELRWPVSKEHNHHPFPLHGPPPPRKCPLSLRRHMACHPITTAGVAGVRAAAAAAAVVGAEGAGVVVGRAGAECQMRWAAARAEEGMSTVSPHRRNEVVGDGDDGIKDETKDQVERISSGNP